MGTGTLRCASCGRALVVIELNLESTGHVLHSCSHCDTRRWKRGAATLDRDVVLQELHERIGRARASSRS